MTLRPITVGLPADLTMQIMPSEVVYYFSFIAFKGGCGSSGKRENFWIALTNKRVVYKTKIMEGNNQFVEKDGILPLDKISFVEVTEGQGPSGCGAKGKIFQLRISSSGGTIIIPIPTKEKGYEIRNVYSQITELP